jgi:hypothetical protein
MENRRKLKRVYLAFFTRLFDRETGELLGHLANLTAEGAMIISETPLEPGKVYRLHMDLSEAFFSKSHLDFEARCVWSQPEEIAPKFYNTGFQFVKIAPEDVQIIAQIIQEYELHD